MCLIHLRISHQVPWKRNIVVTRSMRHLPLMSKMKKNLCFAVEWAYLFTKLTFKLNGRNRIAVLCCSRTSKESSWNMNINKRDDNLVVISWHINKFYRNVLTKGRRCLRGAGITESLKSQSILFDVSAEVLGPIIAWQAVLPHTL